MSYHFSQLPAFAEAMAKIIHPGDLQRSDWKRQTDAIRLAAVIAQMESEAPDKIILVDGRISDAVVMEAVSNGDPKRYFSQRCHDRGLKCRRVIVLDTKATRRMAAGDRIRVGKANLHFHAVFLLDEGQGRPWLAQRLRAVFGEAITLGPRQFRYRVPEATQHKTFAERQGHGVIGKLCYMLDHAGSTYATLGLNEAGKRSRRAPTFRRRCNEHAKGLAQGLPKNFLAGVTICDNASKAAARKAFEAWVATDRSLVRGRTFSVATVADMK